MYGSSLRSVTDTLRASSNAARDADAMPLPREDTTPPVTNTNLVTQLFANCRVIWNRHKEANNETHFGRTNRLTENDLNFQTIFHILVFPALKITRKLQVFDAYGNSCFAWFCCEAVRNNPGHYRGKFVVTINQRQQISLPRRNAVLLEQFLQRA